MSQPPFLVLSLPRSRSAWLSHFLAYDGRRVGHDLALDCDSIENFLKPFVAGLAGSCETGAVLGWKVLRQRLPMARLALVRRPLAEVLFSLERFGLDFDESDLFLKNELLDLVSSLPGVRSWDFDDLRGELACQQLFEFCLGEPFDRDWWWELHFTNIQVDMKARWAKIQSRQPQMLALRAEIAAASLLLPGGAPCRSN